MTARLSPQHRWSTGGSADQDGLQACLLASISPMMASLSACLVCTPQPGTQPGTTFTDRAHHGTEFRLSPRQKRVSQKPC